jgi:phosphatidylinositol-3-phosphatase
MKRFLWLVLGLAACGGSSSNASSGTGAGGFVLTGSATTTTGATTSATTGSGGGAGGHGGSMTTGSGGAGGTTSSTTATTGSGGAGGGCGAGCPAGYTCGTANGLPVCRAASGVPLFTHVFLVMMENTSLNTLEAQEVPGGGAPNLYALAMKYSTGADYHGVAHPSTPNYIALTSGGTDGLTCDCGANPAPAGGALPACTEGLTGNCSVFAELFNPCFCGDQPAMNIADQLEAANLSWMAFGEDMGTPCNVVDSGNYAVRHVPFLFYADIQTNATRCNAHVVDFSNYDITKASNFTYLAPNLIDDMHNPDPTTQVNIPDGDMWVGPQVATITGSAAYKSGGLLVIVWDEDDGSGGILGDTDDPIPVYVISPYGKNGGYVSMGAANHYSLLATFEDGLGLPRLGAAAAGMNTGFADTLSDYFPAN